MQWWTQPSKPTKGRHSNVLSKSLGHTLADIGPILMNFPCYCVATRQCLRLFPAGAGL